MKSDWWFKLKVKILFTKDGFFLVFINHEVIVKFEGKLWKL